MNGPRPWRGLRGEDGSAAVELVLITPLLVILLLVTVGLGRLVWARLQVNDAAGQAARAASLARTAGAATSGAQSTAAQALAGAGLSCTSVQVATDTDGLRPGGTVHTRVTCTTSLAGLTAGILPGSETLSGSASAPVDVYRQDPGSGGGP